MGATVLCALPQVLIWLGVDLSLAADSAGRGVPEPAALVHTLLEWTAVAVAAGVALMALSHFAAARDVITPILGVALFCSAAMDTFHIFAADELVGVVADQPDLIPFTWALSRLLNALILLVGAVLLLTRDRRDGPSPETGLAFVVTWSLACVLVTYAVIQLCVSLDMPRTTYPDAFVSRPWDLAPLVLFVISGVFVYPRFYRAHPSLFSQALLVSAVPQVATQLHMAFGSTALYDAHFNVAHGLKVLAYGVLLLGLLLDYTRTHSNLVERIDEVERAHEALRHSEAPFRRLYESNIIPIMIGDIHGGINEANDAFLSMIGYERSELPIRWVDLTPPEWLPRDEAAIRECHERGVVPVWEKEYLHKDGSRIPILLAVAMLDMQAGTCICPMLDLSERARLEKAVLQRSETERRRLAQNLHDGLGQHLTGMSFLARCLAQELQVDGAPQAGQAARISDLAEQAVNTARTMAQIVCPADLESDGLGPALTRLAANIASIFEVRCEYTQDEAVSIKDDTTATHLFHIAQEAITNAIKHGQARSIAVELAVDDGDLRLTIADDGLGMPPDLQGKTGMGLGIMRHRARMIGAKLQHNGGPDGGTMVVCRIPRMVNLT